MVNGAELEIDDSYDPPMALMSCNYSFQRTVDHVGRPASHVVFGLINCEMAATKNLFLLQAMLTAFNRISGTITFRDTLETGENYTAISLKFKGGCVIDYGDSYNGMGNNVQMLRRFSLAVEEITVIGGSSEEVVFEMHSLGS